MLLPLVLLSSILPPNGYYLRGQRGGMLCPGHGERNAYLQTTSMQPSRRNERRGLLCSCDDQGKTCWQENDL